MNSTSTDAVNGSQLFATQQMITNVTNGGTKYFHANSTLADSQATGANSVAVGPQAVAAAANTVAMGNGAKANNAGDVALGSGSAIRPATAA